MRAFLDGIDWSAPDAVRSLRAAVGATTQRALSSPRAWNAQRAKSPRLPEASVVGIGGADGEDGETRSPRKRRRRRRLQTAAVDAMPAATNGVGPQDAKPDAAGVAAAGNGAAAPDGQMTPARKRRRRRRRRKPAGDGAALANGTGEASESAGEGRSIGRDDASDATPTAA